MNSSRFSDSFSSASTALSSFLASSSLEKYGVAMPLMRRAMLDRAFLVNDSRTTGAACTGALGVVRWRRLQLQLLLEAEEHLVAEGDGLLELLPPLEQRGALDVVLL